MGVKDRINLKDTVNSLKAGQNFLEDFNQRKKIIEDIKTTISKYTEENKLIIIVDELDRTRPDYAIHFLEDMKHFFDIRNVVFLVAVNREQMEATVKCLYGQDLKFDGYYRKFFKQEIYLPNPYKEAQKFIDNLIQKTKVKYDIQEGDRIYRIKSSYFSCKMFNLTLREIESFVRVFEIILGDKTAIASWIFMDCYSFFICFYIKEQKLFKRILNHDFSVNDLLDYLERQNMNVSIQDQKNIEFIPFLLIVFCSLMTKKSEEGDRDKLKEIIPESFERYENTLNDMHKHFRRIGNGYGQFALRICEKINQYESAFTQ